MWTLPAWAIVGVLDEGNEFSFVVQLDTRYSNGSETLCSGVVHSHVVSTAAHCIYDARAGGYARSVSISYVDTLGRPQKARAVKLYVSDIYRDADATSRYDFDVAVHDIGYAVLDREALTDGYLHWGLELLRGIPSGETTCAEPECMDWSLEGERRVGFLRNLEREVGDLSKAKVRVVGYGNFICADYEKREGDCGSDGRRRYVEMPLRPTAANTEAPWLWCTGRGGIDQINPIQHGDSGGPLFIQAHDQRWIYVGYTSGGNSNGGCASSMFSEINLWTRAIAAYDTQEAGASLREPGDQEIQAWQESASRQVFNEWLRNERASEAYWSVDTLSRLYSSDIEYYGRRVSLDALTALKRRYMRQWPERNLTPVSVRVICDEHELHNGDRCTVSAFVDWTIVSSQKRQSGRNAIILTILMPYTFSKALILGFYMPKLVAENGNVLARNVGDAAATERRIKGAASTYENLRDGPGRDHQVVLQVPAGKRVLVKGMECKLPDDTVSAFPFCPATWDGVTGWLSAGALE
jgi:hypothetical protein